MGALHHLRSLFEQQRNETLQLLHQVRALEKQIHTLKGSSVSDRCSSSSCQHQPSPPPISLPPELQKIPATKCIMIRAKKKGSIQTKEGIQALRAVLESLLSRRELDLINEIRPTKYGGFLLGLASASIRSSIFNKLKATEEFAERLRCPSPRQLQLQIKNIPSEYDVNNLERDLYSYKNPAFLQIPPEKRKHKVVRTSAGLLVNCGFWELEAAISQKETLNLGSARQIKIKEFVSLHLCFECCNYGHSGYHCQKGYSRCRLDRKSVV